MNPVAAALLLAAADLPGAPVDSLILTPTAAAVILKWAPPAGVNWLYRVWFGTSPEEMTAIGSTRQAWFRHRLASASGDAGGAFYSVRAFLAEPTPRRDDVMLLDFEDGGYELQSFNEEEDVDPDAWELSSENAPPDSGHSLKLFGNTWKRLELQPIAVTGESVWDLWVRSEDGDTLGDLQGFGLGDGAERLFYAFHGMRVVWEHPWNLTYQDLNPRGEWERFRMAVGYDWTVRFGYEPEVTELVFINDNDHNDPPSAVWFDELADVTESVPPLPRVQITWTYAAGLLPQAEGLGGALTFRALVAGWAPEELTYRWEFGDGAFSSDASPTHHYPGDGVYGVALTVTSPAGGIGRDRARVDWGEHRWERDLSLNFTGDIMLARRYEDQGGIIRLRGPEAVFERVAQRVGEADLTFINLECVLTDEGQPHPTKEIVFRGSPANVAGLTYLGADFAALANNHVHDYGRRGLEETLEVLGAAELSAAGAGLDEYEALQPTFRTVKGLRVGMLAFCNRTGRDGSERPYGDAGYDKFGFAYFSADNLLRAVPDADELCDFLVVYVHGGYEYATEPSRDAHGPREEVAEAWDAGLLADARRDSATRELEHLAIDLGADIVIGTHPHVLQGFEVYNGVLIAHSLGNFAFDQNLFETWPSCLVWADLTDGQVSRVKVQPVFVDRYQPTFAVGQLGAKILNRLADYSQALRVYMVPDYDVMEAEVVFDPDRLERHSAEHVGRGAMRFVATDSVFRSEPVRLTQGGYPEAVLGITAGGENLDCQVRLGREILLVGNMEDEGAAIWNYNSAYERADEQVVHSGQRSSYLERPARSQDAVTDLIQRIPADFRSARMTLCGYLRTENARNAALAARYYRYRYDNNPVNILGDQVVERRLQGDQDWTYLWDDLLLPEDAYFVNVRWQLFGPNQGIGRLWADDLELVLWDDWEDFQGRRDLPAPNDRFYLQVQTRREVAQVEVTYRSVSLGY